MHFLNISSSIVSITELMDKEHVQNNTMLSDTRYIPANTSLMQNTQDFPSTIRTTH